MIPFLFSNLDNDHIGFSQQRESVRVLNEIKMRDLAEHSSVYLPDLGYGDFLPE